MSELQLFADDGELRPPGVPDTARYGDGTTHMCPACREKSLDWFSLTRAECLRSYCGYFWRRSSQLHHTEPLPY